MQVIFIQPFFNLWHITIGLRLITHLPLIVKLQSIVFYILSFYACLLLSYQLLLKRLLTKDARLMLDWMMPLGTSNIVTLVNLLLQVTIIVYSRFVCLLFEVRCCCIHPCFSLSLEHVILFKPAQSFLDLWLHNLIMVALCEEVLLLVDLFQVSLLVMIAPSDTTRRKRFLDFSLLLSIFLLSLFLHNQHFIVLIDELLLVLTLHLSVLFIVESSHLVPLDDLLLFS